MYRVIGEDECDDIIVAFMLAQEQDHYTHTLNLNRYDQMLLSLPEGKWKKRVQSLREQTVARLAEVESIIAATETQMPPQDRLDASKLRLKKKVT